MSLRLMPPTPSINYTHQKVYKTVSKTILFVNDPEKNGEKKTKMFKNMQ